MELKDEFVLDNIWNVTRCGDKVVFLHVSEETNELDMFVAKVISVRVDNGAFEVNAAGPYGGWKDKFYRVLKREEVTEQEEAK